MTKIKIPLIGGEENGKIFKHERIQLRIVLYKESGVSEVRFWHKD